MGCKIPQSKKWKNSIKTVVARKINNSSQILSETEIFVIGNQMNC